MVHVRNTFFTVCKIVRCDTKGIFQSIKQGMHYKDMRNNWTEKLVSFGTEGAAVNLAENGLKGQLKQVAPWMETVWCLDYRFELALKDALKNTHFSSIDGMLLWVYFCVKISRRSVGNWTGSLRG